MTDTAYRGDLVVVVADKDMEQTMNGLLARPQSIHIRSVTCKIHPHPAHDAGCRTGGVAFLRAFCNQYEHALLMFDREGSGWENREASDIENGLEKQLAKNGWQDDRAAVIVLDPELEIWVWSDSPEVDRIMGWSGRIPALRDWLVDEGFLDTREGKPGRPKESFRAALKEKRKQPSAALFKQMAESVSFRRCTDRAFQKLTAKLREWFPDESEAS